MSSLDFASSVSPNKVRSKFSQIFFSQCIASSVCLVGSFCSKGTQLHHHILFIINISGYSCYLLGLYMTAGSESRTEFYLTQRYPTVMKHLHLNCPQQLTYLTLYLWSYLEQIFSLHRLRRFCVTQKFHNHVFSKSAMLKLGVLLLVFNRLNVSIA